MVILDTQVVILDTLCLFNIGHSGAHNPLACVRRRKWIRMKRQRKYLKDPFLQLSNGNIPCHTAITRHIGDAGRPRDTAVFGADFFLKSCQATGEIAFARHAPRA